MGLTLMKPDGYLRIKTRGPLRDKLAHRAYAERQLGRSLREDEEVHHLCRNRTCWPPTDYHLLILDARLHHAIDSGATPHRIRKMKKVLDNNSSEAHNPPCS